MSSDTQSLENAVNAYINNASKTTGDGTYHHTAKTVLNQWLTWCAEHDFASLEDLSPNDIRQYVQHLNNRMRDDKITSSTVHTYFNIVRGCLSWCVTDSRIDTNPADSHPALEALPDNTQDPTSSQQFWTPTEIQRILAHVNTNAHTAIDENPLNAIAPARDCGLIHTLIFSGARGAELFSTPTDTRTGRNGITWNRVDIDNGTIEVLGKSQDWEHAQLPDQATHALHQHYRIQNPANDNWPVFPTLHAPSLYNTARNELAERGYSETDIENFITDAENPIWILRDKDICPPALTTEGARSVMKRLCADADIHINGEYLKPHGGRRGLGHILYQEKAELSQSALRHKSIETTHDAYSDIVASETSDIVTDVLDSSLNTTGE